MQDKTIETYMRYGLNPSDEYIPVPPRNANHSLDVSQLPPLFREPPTVNVTHEYSTMELDNQGNYHPMKRQS